MDEKTLKKLIGKWQKLMNLPEMTIDHEIVEQSEIDAAGGEGAHAAVSHMPCQMEATIKFSAEWFEEATDSEIEAAVIHEMLHVLLQEAWCDGSSDPWTYSQLVLRERAINRIMLAFVRCQK